MLPQSPYPDRLEDAARPYARWMHGWPAGAPPSYVGGSVLTRLLAGADLAAGDVELVRLEVGALRAALRRLFASHAGLEADLEDLRAALRARRPVPKRPSRAGAPRRTLRRRK